MQIASIRGAKGKTVDFRSLGPDESLYHSRTLAPEEQKILGELAGAKQEAIVLEQRPNGSFVLTRTGSPEALEVASITAATDALANGLLRSAGGRDGVSVLMKGVPDAKAEAMLSFVQSSLRRYPRQTVDHVLSSESSAGLLVRRPVLVNARVAHNGIRIEHAGITIEKVTTGPYKGFSRVEVPVTVQAKTPLLLRLVFFVRDMSVATRDAILNKVQTVLASLSGPVSPAQVSHAVRQQLRSDLRELGVDAVLMRIDKDASGKVHDVIIAGEEPRELGAA